jgi:AraC-like DNA-binding protein
MNFDLAYRQLINPKKLRSTSPAHSVAIEFEDSLLGIESFPDEHLAFVCKILSDRIILARAGVEYLVMALYSDREKLSESQLQRIFDCLEKSYALVSDETLAVALGDFIARVMHPEKALKLLQNLITQTTNKAELTGIFVGLDILRRRAKTGELSKQAVDAVLAAAQARNNAKEKE